MTYVSVMSTTRSFAIVAFAAALAACNAQHGALPMSPQRDAVAHAPRTAATPTGPPMWQVTFAYTGKPATWTVPAGLNAVIVNAYGAQGSNALGGSQMATIPVTPGQQLTVVVGGQSGSKGAGGYNGGGNGGTFCCSGRRGWGGGGASDIRVGGTGLQNRIIVAGGGGGASGGGWAGGYGGGRSGGNGNQSSTYARGAGAGGTQTSGGKGAGGTNGVVGNGGNGESSATGTFGGGGGGGGYYGGGGGRASDRDQATGLDTGDSGGGGGSSYAYAKATDVTTVPEVRYGNGLVVLSWLQEVQTFASGLTSPTAIAMDAKGNLYVSLSPSIVKQITPGGVKTLVGSGFGTVRSLAVDSNGNVYVGDTGKQKIWKVAPPFNTSTNGTVTALLSGVAGLRGIAADGAGNVYFTTTESSDADYGSLDKLAPGGAKTILINGLFRPRAVAVNNQCKANCVVYAISSNEGERVYNYFLSRIGTDGKVTQVQNFNLQWANKVAIDAANNAYLSDETDNAVALVPYDGGPAVWLGSGWNAPRGIAVSPLCSQLCPVFVTESGTGLIKEVR